MKNLLFLFLTGLFITNDLVAKAAVDDPFIDELTALNASGNCPGCMSLNQLQGSDITHSLVNGNLTGVSLANASLQYINLSGANLSSATLTGIDLTGANLTGANLTGADLSGATLVGTIFTSANLTNISLYSANLTNANFTSANLTGAGLGGANLQNTNFTNATLMELMIGMTQGTTGIPSITTKGGYTTDYIGIDTAQNLNTATFVNAVMPNAFLSNVNLSGANFSGADLSFARLDGANISGTNLNCTSFMNATVTNTTGAPITGTPSNITGLNLSRGGEATFPANIAGSPSNLTITYFFNLNTSANLSDLNQLRIVMAGPRREIINQCSAQGAPWAKWWTQLLNSIYPQMLIGNNTWWWIPQYPQTAITPAYIQKWISEQS